METTVFLGLGSNVGDRKKYLEQAVRLLQNEVRVEAVSSTYATEPWGYQSENGYYNSCLRGKTTLSPEELLDLMHQVEQTLGRVRLSNGYSDRTIDVDLLFYGDLIHRSDRLVLPHPAIPYRNFVLAPLNDVGKNFRHPVYGRTVNELFVLSLDDSNIARID